MSDRHGERLIDVQTPQLIFAVTSDTFASAGAAFAIAYNRHDWKQPAGLDDRVATLKRTASDIQQTGQTIASGLRDEYLSSMKALTDHQSVHGLPNDWYEWSNPKVASTLTEAESADHATWRGFRAALSNIDANSSVEVPDATKLNETAFNAARGRAYMPSFSRLQFPEGTAAFRATGEYNGMVGQFNQVMDGIKQDHGVFAKADRAYFGKVAAGTLAAVAVDTALDYTLMKNRSHSAVAFATDLVSPMLSALLIRKAGPAAAFIGPVAAHLAEKFLYEHKVDV